MEAQVRIETSEGAITVLLYDKTPLHRDNFLKIVRNGTLDGTLFHRVIREFMIQAGDPDSKTAQKGQSLGSGDLGYTVPAEIVYPDLFHKRGVLAAARQGDQVNPEKASSACQFYIVTGKVYSDSLLAQMEKQKGQQRMNDLFYALAAQHKDEITALRKNRDQEGLMNLQDSLIAQAEKAASELPGFKFTPEQRQAYTTVGGTPHLDQAYTVFGEVIEGMDVVQKIEKAQTDQNDRPMTDIVIKKAVILED